MVRKNKNKKPGQATPFRYSCLLPQDVQLPPALAARDLGLRVRVRDIDEPPDGNLAQRNEPSLLGELEAKVQGEEDGDIDVTGDEGFGVPVARQEGGVAARQQQEDEHDQREPRRVRLEGPLPRQLVARDALRPAAVVEAQVDEADDGPGHQRSDRDEVLQPREGRRGAAGQRHEAEADEQAGERHADVLLDGGEEKREQVSVAAIHEKMGGYTNRNAHSVGAQKDLGGVVLLGHAVQRAGGAQHERVAGAPGARQDDEVDDVRHDIDAGAGGGDDKGRRGRGVRVGAQQLRVVGWHQHADEEYAEHVEDGHTPEDSPGRDRDVAPGVLCLRGRLGDVLDAAVWFHQYVRRPAGRLVWAGGRGDKSECLQMWEYLRVGVHGIVKGGPEAEELAEGAWEAKILRKWTWVAPVLEADDLVVGTTTSNNDNGLSQGLGKSRRQEEGQALTGQA